MKNSIIAGLIVVSIVGTVVVMRPKVAHYESAYNRIQAKEAVFEKQVKQLKMNNQHLSAQLAEKAIDPKKSKMDGSKGTSVNVDHVQSFFETMLNYNNGNFTTRYEKAKAYAGDQPISVFQVTKGHVEAPKTTIDCKMIDYHFYVDSKDHQKGVVVVKVQLNYQGQKQVSTTDYSVDLNADGTLKNLSQRVVANDN